MKSYEFLFWGDLIVFAGLTAYIVALVRKLAAIDRRLDALEARTGKREASRAT